jgi:hypothetical protein
MLRPFSSFSIDSTIICEELEYMSLVFGSRKVCDRDLESDIAARSVNTVKSRGLMRTPPVGLDNTPRGEKIAGQPNRGKRSVTKLV